MNMNRVLYPGSFDPITKGHMNIIEQSSYLFDEIIVAIMRNPKKNCFFTLEERFDLISKLYKDFSNVNVIIGSGAAVDVALLNECKAIIRGLRSLSDYDYEIQLQQINKDLSNNKINTICLFADRDYQFISSSIVKEIFLLNKSITEYVDPYVEKQMILKKGTNYV